ncbi:hypothetical protein [uncultured Thalassospira sp.]|uniref:hypothetical protein n=1 Tax=uncultured Thalassospira sp. TaxID=404382 RepID=UPI0025884DB7|nr:hypothetical protein [uncultured Thalassospira sp.]
MVLTLYDHHAAQLDDLLTDLSQVEPADALELQQARQALLDFKGVTTFEDLELRADAAVKSSIDKALEGFAEHFSAVAAAAESVTSTFKAAEKMAKAGEQELLLNRLNNFLKRTSNTTQAAKDMVSAVKDLGKISSEDAEDAIAKLEAVQAAWVTIRDAVKG